MKKLLPVVLMLAHSAASAVLLDDLADLEGKTVVYAGEFEKLSCSIGGKYDCFKWPSDLFKTKGLREVCFTPKALISCTFSCKGVIAVGSDKKPYVFFVGGLGDDVKKAGFETYACPSLY
jgi:hypothetical protein